MSSILTDQVFVEFSTIIIFILTTALAIFITKRYYEKRDKPHLFWSIGMWLFSASIALEIVFAFAISNLFLINAYLFIVALLVEFLALGSIALLKSRRVMVPYLIFMVVSSVFLIYSLAITDASNVIINYVVAGALPLLTVLSSSIATFPAAVILIVVAALGYRKSHNKKMLSIIGGVVVVSFAGTLYISSFPSLLYYAEFLGIVLLWFGFV